MDVKTVSGWRLRRDAECVKELQSDRKDDGADEADVDIDVDVAGITRCDCEFERRKKTSESDNDGRGESVDDGVRPRRSSEDDKRNRDI